MENPHGQPRTYCSLRTPEFDCRSSTNSVKSKSYCDWRSVSLGVEPLLGLMTRYLLLFDSYGLVCAAPSLIIRSLPNSRSIALSRTAEKSPFPTVPLLLRVDSLPLEHVCLRRRYLVTALVYLLISLSLPSTGSTCYNIIVAVLP
jgi:hypothetical protein